MYPWGQAPFGAWPRWPCASARVTTAPILPPEAGVDPMGPGPVRGLAPVVAVLGGYSRIWPSPQATYFEVVSSSRPIGPRACRREVEIPISAPIPYSPPSVNRVEAFT